MPIKLDRSDKDAVLSAILADVNTEEEGADESMQTSSSQADPGLLQAPAAELESTATVVTKSETCGTCQSESARYTCPACSVRSCSLACVKAHKAAESCSGRVAPEKYLPMEDFTESTLLRDRTFLDIVSQAKRDSRSAFIKLTSTERQNRVNRLVNQAKPRLIKLELVARGLQKHKENSSRFESISKQIMWRVKFVFPEEGGDSSMDQDDVPENSTLREIVNKAIEEQESLTKYQSDDTAVLMFVEQNHFTTKESYHRLDLNAKLVDALRLKIIVEYPTLLVIPSSKLEEYNILSDQDRWNYFRCKLFSSKEDVSLLNLEQLSFIASSWQPGQPMTAGRAPRLQRQRKKAAVAAEVPSGNAHEAAANQRREAKQLLRLSRLSKRVSKNNVRVSTGKKGLDIKVPNGLPSNIAEIGTRSLMQTRPRGRGGWCGPIRPQIHPCGPNLNQHQFPSPRFGGPRGGPRFGSPRRPKWDHDRPRMPNCMPPQPDGRQLISYGDNPFVPSMPAPQRGPPPLRTFRPPFQSQRPYPRFPRNDNPNLQGGPPRLPGYVPRHKNDLSLKTDMTPKNPGVGRQFKLVDYDAEMSDSD